MTADSHISIQRWTNLSIGVAIVVAVLFVLLAAGPAFLSENILDRLTVLFIYVCLAVMWNALAGYGGMISAGQQAFFGLGGYLAIRLSEWGVEPYLALVLAALLAGVFSLPISAIVLRLRGGEFAIGMWVIAEVVRLLVNLDPIIQGDTGRSLIALASFDAAERRDLTYWMTLASMSVMLAVIFLHAAEPARLFNSSHPGQRGSRRLGRSKSIGHQAHYLCHCRHRLRACRRSLAGYLYDVSAAKFLRHSVECLHDIHGAGRRHRALRGTDPRRHNLLSYRTLVRHRRRMVPHCARPHRAPLLAISTGRHMGLCRGSFPRAAPTGRLSRADAGAIRERR